MKIEIDVLGIPEGYEATAGRFTPYSEGPGRMWGWVDLRKKKHEVIVFEKVDEFVECDGGAEWHGWGWGSSLQQPYAGISLYIKGFRGFPLQWYRREERLED